MPIRLIKKPRNVDNLTYDHAAQSIARYSISHSSVKAVYRMGSVAHPGISDLDIVIVIDDNASVPLLHFSEILQREEKSILIHPPFVVTESFWKHRELFFSFSNLRLIAGHGVQSHSLGDTINQWTSQRVAVQHLLRTTISLELQRQSGVFRAQSLLCELNALKYSFDALRKSFTTAQHDKTNRLLSRIDSVRSSWFGLDNQPETLSQLADRSTDVLYFLFQRVGEYLADEYDHLGGIMSSVEVSKNRTLYAGPDIHASVNFAFNPKVIGSLPLGNTHLARLLDRCSAIALTVPASLLSIATVRPWIESDDSEQADYMARRIEILSSTSIKEIRSMGYSLPCLDFEDVFDEGEKCISPKVISPNNDALILSQ